MARAVKIAMLGDSRSLQRALAQSESRMGRLQSSAGKMGKALGVGFAVAGVAAVGFAATTIKSASDAQQSIGATETVFGKYSKSIIDNSNKAAKAVGLSANEYRESANLIGALLGNKGFEGKALVGATDALVKKGADLAATFGGPTTDAVDALSAAFKGEFDSLDKYGISLNADKIATEANALAKKKYGKELSSLTSAQQDNIKAQATQNEINKQSAKATGAFSRETKTFAHQQQVLSAQFENIKTKVGSVLLPVLTKLGTWFNDKAIPFAEKYAPILRDKLGGGFDKVKSAVDGVMPVLTTVGNFMKDNPTVVRNAAITLGVLATAIGIVAAVTAVWNAILLVNPLTWIVLGIVALVAVITYLVTHWKDVTKWTGKVWDKVKGFGKFLRDEFIKLIAKTGDFAKSMGEKLWTGITKIGSKLKTIGTWIWNNVYPGPLLKLADKVLGASKSIGGKVWTGITNVGGKLKTIGSWAWGKFEGGLNTLKSKFTDKGGDLLSGMVSGLKNRWGAVRELTKKPLNLIIDVAVNPFIKTINKLPGVDIDYVKGFARGGWTGPGSKYQPAGIVHADEFVINKESRRAIEGRAPGFLDRLNGFAKGGRVWPLKGGVTSTYAGHSGVDLNAPNDMGAPVHAVTSGTAYPYSSSWAGNSSVRLVGGGTSQIYAHLSGRGRMGKVSAGDVIGYVGSEGNSTGPHLHFQIDPSGYGPAMGFLQGASQPTGGGFLSKLLGTFDNAKDWALNKASGLLGKLSGGGLLSTANIKAFSKHILDKFISKIPGMATGGIVRASSGGTIIRAGEGGVDEAIVPMRRNSSGRKIEVHNHYAIHVSPISDSAAVIKELNKSIREAGEAGVRLAI